MALRIRDLRIRRDLTQEDLADLAGVPIEIVRDIEAGVQEVGSDQVERIRRVLQSGTKKVTRDRKKRP